MNPKQIPKLCSGMLLPARLFPGNTFAFSAADAERLPSRGCGERASAGSSLPQQARPNWTLGAGQGKEAGIAPRDLSRKASTPTCLSGSFLSWYYDCEHVHLFMYRHPEAKLSSQSQTLKGPRNEYIQVSHSCLA